MPGIGEFLHEHLITSVQSSGAFWPDQARQTRAKNAEREGYGGLPDKVINDDEKLTFPLSSLLTTLACHFNLLSSDLEVNVFSCSSNI